MTITLDINTIGTLIQHVAQVALLVFAQYIVANWVAAYKVRAAMKARDLRDSINDKTKIIADIRECAERIQAHADEVRPIPTTAWCWPMRARMYADSKRSAVSEQSAESGQTPQCSTDCSTEERA